MKLQKHAMLVMLVLLFLALSFSAALSSDAMLMIRTVDRAGWTDVPPPALVRSSVDFGGWLIIPTLDEPSPSDLPPVITP